LSRVLLLVDNVVNEIHNITSVTSSKMQRCDYVAPCLIQTCRDRPGTWNRPAGQWPSLPSSFNLAMSFYGCS